MANGFFQIKKGLNLGSATGDPSGGAEGDSYYNSTTKKNRQYLNASWRDVITNDDSQTMSSKTLTSPVINSATINTSTIATPAISNATFSGTTTFPSTTVIDSSGNLSVVGTTTLYASGSTNSSIGSATNWLRSAKNTVTGFIGNNDVTSGYTASEFSGNLRFNGASVAWGDFGYYPNGGDDGEYGHFRLSLAGSTIVTTPNAKLGIGDLYVNGKAGIGTASPATKLHIGDGSTNEQIYLQNSTADLALGVSGGTFMGFSNGNISLVINSTSVPLGIATNAAQPLILGTHDTERMRITSDGNIGVGTTTPAFIVSGSETGMQVVSSSTNAAGIGVQSSNGTSSAVEMYAAYSTDEAGLVTSTGGSTKLNFRTGSSGTVRMTILGTGLVGIGTAAPGNILHVYKSSTAPVYTNLENPSTSGSTASVGLSLTTYDGSSSATHGYIGQTGNSWSGGNNLSANSTFLYGDGAGGTSVSAAHASGVIDFHTGGSNTQRMRVDASGDLLVGTTTAGTGALVTINGNASVVNNSYYGLQDDAGNAGVRFGIDTSNNGYIGNFNSGGDFTFRTQTGGTHYFNVNATEKMRINSTGVGVGGVNPAYTFDVLGNARIRSADAASTFVFSEAHGSGAVPYFAGQRSRGTNASPTAVHNADALVQISGYGYGSTAYGNAPAYMTITASETWTDSAQGAAISFGTVATGTVTQAEAMRIDPSGKVGIATNAPDEKLHVVGTIKIVDGNQGAGKVFTSDANGKGNWANPGTTSAPTVQKFLTTGSTSGCFVKVTGTTSVTAGATYTNGGHTYTALNTLASAAAGTLLFFSGVFNLTGTTTVAFVKSGGTGDSGITGYGPSTAAYLAPRSLATYTLPTSPSPLYIKVKVIGGGGGGGGSSDASNNGVVGGKGSYSTFGINLLLSDGGWGGGSAGSDSNGGQGGAAAISSPALGMPYTGCAGSAVGAAGAASAGSIAGASGPFGGGGLGIAAATAGSAIANSGGGGAGACSPSSGAGYTGGSGGAGGYADALITSPSSTYYYCVAVGGEAGTAGTNGYAGGAGGTGLIIIEEHYQ